MEYIIYNDNKKLFFEVIYSKRKSFAIYFEKNGQIKIKSPKNLSLKIIKERILEKIDWILKKKSLFKDYKEEKYLTGESFKYLGNSYQLKVLFSNKNEAFLIGNKFYIHSKEPKNEIYNQKVLYKLLKKKAETIFNQRLIICYKRFKKRLLTALNTDLIPKYKSLKIRKMKSRWGSCSINKEIVLNLELIKKDLDCIDYVIFHELCHLIELNHSKNFYFLLTQVLENWKSLKIKLNNF